MRCGVHSRVLFAGLAVLGALVPAHAQTFALSSVGPVAGNQAFAGILGQDFTVNSTILLDSIGVFNAGGTGTIASNLTVALYQLDGLGNGTLVANTLQVFGPSAGNTVQAGSFIMKSLIGAGPGGSNIVLGTGNYSLVAFGFTAADPNYNSFGAPTLINLNNGGGLLTFGNIRWNSNPAATPSNADSSLNEAGRFGAATIRFSSATSAPEPGSLAFLALGVGSLALVRRRRN